METLLVIGFGVVIILLWTLVQQNIHREQEEDRRRFAAYEQQQLDKHNREQAEFREWEKQQVEMARADAAEKLKQERQLAEWAASNAREVEQMEREAEAQLRRCPPLTDEEAAEYRAIRSPSTDEDITALRETMTWGNPTREYLVQRRRQKEVGEFQARQHQELIDLVLFNSDPDRIARIFNGPIGPDRVSRRDALIRLGVSATKADNLLAEKLLAEITETMAPTVH